MTTLSTPRRLLALAAAGGAALVLAGCGSGGSTPSATASAGSGPGQANAGQGGPGVGPGQGRDPGVSGLIAAVQGSTVQVQGNGEQTAVIYTAKTTFTTQVAATAAAVKVGDCVSARPAQTAGTTSASPDTAAGGSSTIAAATVTILSSDGSGCTDLVGAGFGAPLGGFGGGGFGGGTPPSGAPTGRPSGAPSGFGNRGAFGAVGEVTAVSSGSFTVSETVRGFDRGATAGASPSASATTRPVTVTYTSSTTFESTKKTTSKAITVGGCVRALGAPDDTGTVTATSMALSPAVDGQCTSAVRGG